MAVRQTALVGKLQISGKEARAELDAVKKKMDDLGRNSTKAIALKIRTEYEGPGKQSLPQAAVAQLKQQQAVLSLNGAVMRSNKQLGESGRNAGAGMLELSRAFEDAQYGIRGALNNVPAVIQNFGGSAGLAAAASVAAVSLYAVYQSYEYMTTALGKNKEVEAAARQERLAKATAETARRVREVTASYEEQRSDLTRREAGGMAHYARDMDYTNRSARAGNRLARAGLAGGESSPEKDLALAEFDRKEEAAALTREIDLQSRIAGIEEARAQESAARLQNMEKEFQALARESQSFVALDGTRQTRVGFQKQSAARGQELEKMMATERDRLDAVTGRRDAARAAGEEATFRRNVELPGDAAADKETAKSERQRLTRDSARKFAEGLGKVADSLVESFRDAGRTIAARVKEQAAARADTDTALSVSEERNPRSRRRLGRADAFLRRTQDLVTKEGRSPLEAASIAAREQRAADRASGDRTIRGAGPASKFGGLDEYTRDKNIPMGQKPQAPAEAQGRAAINKAIDDVRRSAGGTDAGNQIVSKLSELITAVKEQKGPSERGKPLRSN